MRRPLAAWPPSRRVDATRQRRVRAAPDEVQNPFPRRPHQGRRDPGLADRRPLLIETTGGGFVSLLDPPAEAQAAAADCRQHRCWPVLAGPAGRTDVVLVSPIILYDHPEVAPESAGELFDSTEIDEILTLRVLTLTDAEKAEARATDPRAAEIIDRCENMSPEDLQRLHGVLRDPHALAAATDPAPPGGSAVPPEFAEAVAAVQLDAETPWFDTGGQPWWDPAVDERVQPEVDAVVIDGVSVSKGSLVRVHPNRRADAQDLFFADQVARVTAVLGDVDGGTARRRGAGRRPGRRPARLVRPLPLLRPGRAGTPACPALNQKGAPAMNTLGKITTGLLIGMALGAVVVTVLSTPDIRRYFKIRSM